MSKGNKSIIIAVDGNSASGKGTLSTALAKHFGFAFLDTGLLYRFLAKNILVRHMQPDDLAQILPLIDELDFANIPPNTILHTAEISDIASQVAPFAEVRTKLNLYQRNFPLSKKGVVIDGRDIGTVIFPDADCKLYITADVQTRAMRRYQQLRKFDDSTSYAQVLADLRVRDERDAHRSNAPLQQAADAVVIDTTYKTVEQTLQAAIAIVDGVLRCLA